MSQPPPALQVKSSPAKLHFLAFVGGGGAATSGGGAVEGGAVHLRAKLLGLRDARTVRLCVWRVGWLGWLVGLAGWVGCVGCDRDWRHQCLHGLSSTCALPAPPSPRHSQQPHVATYPGTRSAH